MHRSSGRVSFVSVLVVGAVVALGASLLLLGDSMESTGSKFMDALARRDVNTLTELSYMPGLNQEQVMKAWDFSVNTAGEHYRFSWKAVRSEQTGENNGSVQLQIQRNLDSGGSYDENFQLPMTKTKEGWKVDVRAISREMFPGLPR